MQSYNPLDTVVFGLEGVIFAAAPGRTAARLSRALALPLDRIERALAPGDALRRFERGEIDGDRYRLALSEALGAAIEPELFRSAWTDIYGDYLPGMRELVPRLAASLRVVGIANVDPLRLEVVRARYEDVLDPFDRLLASCEIGARKPEEAAYEALLAELGVSPEEIGYVDADPMDLSAAAALGIRVFEAGDAESIASDLEPLINTIPGGET